MTMKKRYQKPETQVVIIEHRTYLLSGSPADTILLNEPNYDDWDIDGAQ